MVDDQLPKTNLETVTTYIYSVMTDLTHFLWNVVLNAGLMRSNICFIACIYPNP